MKTTAVIRTKHFQRAWHKLPPRRQKLVSRKIRQLAENPKHPSLHAHRVVRQASAGGLWICYLTTHLRLLYQCSEKSIYLWDVGTHTIVDRLHIRQFPTRHHSQPSRSQPFVVQPLSASRIYSVCSL